MFRLAMCCAFGVACGGSAATDDGVEPCESQDPPSECYFQPGEVSEGGGVRFRPQFGYDPTNNVVRSYFNNDNAQPSESYPFAFVHVLDARYRDSERPTWRCGAIVQAKQGETFPVTLTVRTMTTAMANGDSTTTDFHWYETAFPPGSFIAIDAVGTVGACSERHVDPERYPEGLLAALESQTWIVGWGSAAPALAHLTRSDVVGGGVGIARPDGDLVSPFSLVQAYSLDDAFVMDDGPKRSADEMTPTAEDGVLPARGMYSFDTDHAFDGSWLDR